MKVSHTGYIYICDGMPVFHCSNNVRISLRWPINL